MIIHVPYKKLNTETDQDSINASPAQTPYLICHNHHHEIRITDPILQMRKLRLKTAQSMCTRPWPRSF